MSSLPASQDERYLQLILDKINVCKQYRPKFGQGKALSFEEFALLYQTDPFYAWFGLENPLMYAAHKAAGGITSLYRQIGIGCEQLVRQIIRDQFDLSDAQVLWSYQVVSAGRTARTLSLDARIELEDLRQADHKQRVQHWMRQATLQMGLDPAIADALKGAVFEIRQGYKSKDAKRQNADIGNAGSAYAQGYLPVVLMLSTQIDADVATRYAAAGWLLLQGNLSPSPITSTYAFCAQVLGYDLAAFFQRHSSTIKQTVDEVLATLLMPGPPPDEALSPAALIARDELEGVEEIEDGYGDEEPR